jgi:hypothetical membrane protein
LKEQYYALFGLLGPLFGVIFILMTIVLSPWFSWESNALSDLGHSVQSDGAPLFNFGLLICGFFIIAYSITIFKKYAKYTSYCLVFVGLALQLVATFDEIYGVLHFQVSVLFFLGLGFTSVLFFIEKKSLHSIVAFSLSFGSWIIYGLGMYNIGIAVPEIISALTVASWIMLSSLRLYRNNSNIEK